MTKRPTRTDNDSQVARVAGTNRIVVLTPEGDQWTATVIDDDHTRHPVEGAYRSVSTALLAGLKAEQAMGR